MKSKSPTLYIVATPIGNLGDMTFRAVDVLNAVDLIACEDTRQSRKLLQHFNITTPTCSYHDHSDDKKRHDLLGKLEAGDSIALISDAGTPLISDPGYKLVVEAREAGYDVVPIPGASSTIAALCASGLPTDQFHFAGFLPSKAGERRKKLEELNTVPGTICLFESPKRLADRLQDIMDVMGDRETVVAREITKLHEEFRKGKVSELLIHYKESDAPKGEAVLLIGPAEKIAMNDAEVDALLKEKLASLPVKQTAAEVSELTGIGKSELYQRALSMKKND